VTATAISPHPVDREVSNDAQSRIPHTTTRKVLRARLEDQVTGMAEGDVIEITDSKFSYSI
jgi:hypothetical protein